eukprot:14846782-Alexandrium_andersonii.AAC.1
MRASWTRMRQGEPPKEEPHAITPTLQGQRWGKTMRVALARSSVQFQATGETCFLRTARQNLDPKCASS